MAQVLASEQPLVFGRYLLGSRAGVGAAGSVFRARDVQSGHDVVIKFFDGQEDGFSPWASEMRLVMRFKHPHIVPCVGAGFDDIHRLWALVFEQARGGSLRRALAAGRKFSPQQSASLLTQIAEALTYAHAQGVVHRDIKPEKLSAVEKSPAAAPAAPLIAGKGAHSRSRLSCCCGASCIRTQLRAGEIVALSSH